MAMKAKIFKNFITVVLSEMYQTKGSIGDLRLGPLLFLSTLIDRRKGKRGCRGCSLPLARVLAGMPSQLKVFFQILSALQRGSSANYKIVLGSKIG